MNHVKKTQGFTLIELMLAMAFISILLLAIAMTILQISQIYNRGVTLREVNQVARTISDDLNRDIAGSESFSLSLSAHHYISQTWGGRLCLGQYSYIWNYGTALNNNDPNLSVYTTGTTPIHFVKVPDVGANYCSGSPAYQKIDPTNAVELLQVTDHNLAIHQLSLTSSNTSIDTHTGERLYVVTFTIGTNDTNALTSDLTSCKGPGQSGSDLEYCSVQQFTLVVRTQNAVN